MRVKRLLAPYLKPVFISICVTILLSESNVSKMQTEMLVKHSAPI